MSGSVHSVNISSGGVPKSSVTSASVRKAGVEGDFNIFRDSRGGDPERAVCIFSLEKIEDLKKEGHPIEVGSTGENITLEGVQWDALREGLRIEVGNAVLELSEPCAPCSKIGESFVERRFDRIDYEHEKGWSRWLARVVQEGLVSVGDSVNVIVTSEK